MRSGRHLQVLVSRILCCLFVYLCLCLCIFVLVLVVVTVVSPFVRVCVFVLVLVIVLVSCVLSPASRDSSQGRIGLGRWTLAPERCN